MRVSVKTILAAISAFAIVGCSGAAEEEPAVETAETNAAEVATAQPAPSTEAFEVCDADGNRYASEADAEAAGLDRAEYGATFCEYAE